MKILLLGGSGQLGFEIRQRAHDLNFEVVSPVSSELDLANPSQVSYLTKMIKPQLIINCAAYTAVDKAEEEPDAAMRINRDGAAHAAQAALENNSRLIHISTDYVFPGTGSTPLRETDATGPTSVYGQSKLDGENKVLSILGEQALVIRTSSLHGQKGENFVHTMLRLFSEKPMIRVVDDQFMCPTWAGWFSEVLLDLVRIPAHGVLHACGRGVCSWFDFANAVLTHARPRLEDGSVCKLERTKMEDFPRPAKRPQYSALDCSRLSELLGREPITWQDGLKAHLREINRLVVDKI